MTDDIPPTIPEIVRALTTLDDRHQGELRETLREVKAAHDRQRLGMIDHFDTLKREYERVTDRRDISVAALNEVVTNLETILESIRKRANADQRDAVYMDAGDVARMARVNVQTMREHALRHAEENAEREKKIVQQGSGKPEVQAATEPSCGALGASETGRCAVCGHWRDQHDNGASHCRTCHKLNRLDMGCAHTFQVITAGESEPGESVKEVAKEDGIIKTALAEDICTCGHPRRQHLHHSGPHKGCTDCSSSAAMSWNHSFTLAVL